jgi:phospholipase C
MAHPQDEIDQIVVVMMENRSFDHMLGYWALPPWNGTPRRDPVDGVQPGFTCRDAHGLAFQPFEIQLDDLTTDLPHSRGSTWRQMARDPNDLTRFHMDGFVKESFPNGDTPARPFCMGYFTPRLIPVTHMLATEFTVCDRWFTPIPTDTHPNRMVAIAGWTPYDETQGELVDASPTVVDFLLGRQVDLRIYARRLSFLALSTSTISHAKQLLRPWSAFADDWKQPVTGPRVTYVEPAYRDLGPVFPNPPADDDHPPTPVAFGQAFLHEVYRVVRSNDERWRRTLMIVTYDEHGGFADHVQPMPIDSPSPLPDLYPRFPCTGPRVPAIIVSPWVNRLGTSHLPFDHTSILRTLVDKFDPGNQRAFKILGPAGAGAVDCVYRRNVASLWSALDLTACRDDAPELPDPPPLPAGQPPENPNLLTKAGQLAVQEITRLFGVLP